MKLPSFIFFLISTIAPISGAQETQPPPLQDDLSTTSDKVEKQEEPSIYHIFDERGILDEKQIEQIKSAQKQLLSKHHCAVSYGFYDGHILDITVHHAWKQAINKGTKGQFHLFVNIGAFRKNRIVSLDYKNPPPVKDILEITKILDNLKQDLVSENSLQSLLERSFESLNDELGYLNKKPDLEANKLKEKEETELAKIKEFAMKVGKIVAYCTVSLIAFILLCISVLKIRNRIPYRFPDVEYTTRLGAKYAATSISKITK